MGNDRSVLDQIRIASPCSASWDAMEGGDRVRFCAHCEKNVYNLSGMSRREAERLVREHEWRLCVRFYVRRDGTILTDDCPVGLRAVRRRLAMHISSIAALLGGLLALGVRQTPLSRVAGLRAFGDRLGSVSEPVTVAGGIGPAPIQDAAAVWRRTEIVGGGSAGVEDRAQMGSPGQSSGDTLIGRREPLELPVLPRDGYAYMMGSPPPLPARALIGKLRATDPQTLGGVATGHLAPPVPVGKHRRHWRRG